MCTIREPDDPMISGRWLQLKMRFGERAKITMSKPGIFHVLAMNQEEDRGNFIQFLKNEKEKSSTLEIVFDGSDLVLKEIEVKNSATYLQQAVEAVIRKIGSCIQDCFGGVKWKLSQAP